MADNKIIAEKDKPLIYGVSLFAMYALTQIFFFNSLDADIEKYQAELEEVHEKQMVIRSGSAMYEDSEEMYNDAISNTASLPDGFCDYKIMEDIEDHLTKIVADVGVVPIGFQSALSENMLMPYNFYDTETASEYEFTISDNIIATDATISVRGDVSEVFELVDRFNDEDGIIVRTVNIAPDSDSVSDGTLLGSMLTASVGLSLYYYDDAYINSVVSEEEFEETDDEDYESYEDGEEIDFEEEEIVD